MTSNDQPNVSLKRRPYFKMLVSPAPLEFYVNPLGQAARLFYVAFVTISAKGHGIIKMIQSKNMVMLIQHSLSGMVYYGTQHHMCSMCNAKARMATSMKIWWEVFRLSGNLIF